MNDTPTISVDEALTFDSAQGAAVIELPEVVPMTALEHFHRVHPATCEGLRLLFYKATATGSVNILHPTVEGWRTLTARHTGGLHAMFATSAAAAAAAEALDAAGWHVWFGAALFDKPSMQDARGKAVRRVAENVKSLRMLFLDLDCGQKKADDGDGYATKRDAWLALNEFCGRIGWPLPLVIDSGNGLHAWWELPAPIPLEAWVLLAGRLKACAAAEGLLADPAVTSDAARVLRLAGLHNRKDRNSPKPINRVHDGGGPLKVQHLERFEAYASRGASAPAQAAGVDQLGEVPAFMHGVNEGNGLAAHTDERSDIEPAMLIEAMQRKCKRFREGTENPVGQTEKTWWTAASNFAHAAGEEGRAAFHAFSEGHPGYNSGEADAKFTRQVERATMYERDRQTHKGCGPTTCAKTEGDDRGGCAGCDNMRADGSFIEAAPIVFARKAVLAERRAHVINARTDSADASMHAGDEFDVERINRDWALIRCNGNMVFATEELDAQSGRHKPAFYGERDFLTEWAPYRVKVGKSTKGWGELWIQHRNRRMCTSMGMIVDGPVPKGVYNLWRGFGIEPLKVEREGSTPGERGGWPTIEKLLRRATKGTDERTHTWVLQWIANMVRNPTTPAGSMILLRGENGTGKGEITRMLARMVGRDHSYSTSSVEQVVGRFNDVLTGCVFLALEEAMFAGDKRTADRMKNLCTERVISVEGKGQRPVQIDNCLHIVHTSNHNHAAVMTGTDRRYLVLEMDTEWSHGARPADMSEAEYHEQCDAYWGPIIASIGGVTEKARYGEEELPAFMWHCLHEQDMTGFSAFRPPSTRAGDQQQMLSLEGVAEWWHGCLRIGRIGMSGPEWPDSVRCDAAWEAWCEYIKGSGTRPVSFMKFGEEFKLLLAGDANGRKRAKVYGAGISKHGENRYLLGTLDAARAEFCKVKKLPRAFDEPDDEV